MKPVALIWGESLVGSGHARIQSEMARGLERDGWQVALVTSSRERVDGFDFGETRIYWQPPLRLTSIHADPYKMSNLITPNGISLMADETYQHERLEFLLDLFDSLKPRAVITEMWPFARANFDFELVPLAEKILGSGDGSTELFSIARDIMFPPALSSPDSPHLQNDRHQLAQRYFKPGHILIRGDDSVLPLESSVGTLSLEVRERLQYVGYFGQEREECALEGLGDVLVTSGGGVTVESLEMFEACMRIRSLTPLADRLWRILVPRTCPSEARARLDRIAKDIEGVVVEDNRPDFLSLLQSSPLLICHGGNTIIEALSLNVPVLVVPREYAKNNREQQIRAKAFEDRGLISTVKVNQLHEPSFFLEKLLNVLSAERKAFQVSVRGAAVASSVVTNRVLGRQKRPPVGRFDDFDYPLDPIGSGALPQFV